MLPLSCPSLVRTCWAFPLSATHAGNSYVTGGSAADAVQDFETVTSTHNGARGNDTNQRFPCTTAPRPPHGYTSMTPWHCGGPTRAEDQRSQLTPLNGPLRDQPSDVLKRCRGLPSSQLSHINTLPAVTTTTTNTTITPSPPPPHTTTKTSCSTRPRHRHKETINWKTLLPPLLPTLSGIAVEAFVLNSPGLASPRLP